jgi:hypothetical protein
LPKANLEQTEEEERQKLLNESIEIQHHLCNHMKLELGLETIFQLCLKLILLAYSKSETRTTEGLSTMFGKDFLIKETVNFLNITILIFLYATTCWSFISNVNSHINGLSSKRKRFPFASKIAAGCYAFFASTSRILTVIIFFTPSLGLFNTLWQLQGEQLQRHPAIIDQFVTKKSLFFPEDSITIQLNSSPIFKTNRNGGYVSEGFDYNMKNIVPEYLQNKTFHIHGEIQYGNLLPIPWSQFDRNTYNLSDISNVKWPDYTIYTFFSLKEYFFIFVGILVTHIIVIFIVKLSLSKNFSNFNILEMIIHCIENANLAYNVEEWDSTKTGNAAAHIERMKSNRLEGLVLILVNFIFKLMMLCPLYILGYNAKVRDDILLREEIRHPKELESVENISNLILGSSLYVLFSLTMEITFFILYNGMLHPFSKILDLSTDVVNQGASGFDKILGFCKCCKSTEQPTNEIMELAQCQCRDSNDQLSQSPEDGIELVPMNLSGPEQHASEKSSLLDPKMIEGAAVIEENVSTSEGEPCISKEKQSSVIDQA